MSNKIGPEGIDVLSDPSNYIIVEKPSRQGGVLPHLRGIGRTVTSIIATASFLFPVDSPIKTIRAESQNQQQSLNLESYSEDDYYTNPPEGAIMELSQQTLTLLHGDGNKDKLNIVYFRHGISTERIEKVAKLLFNIAPTNEFPDLVNLYLDPADHTSDFQCNQDVLCKDEVIESAIKSISLASGKVMHGGIVVIDGKELYHCGMVKLRL